MEALVILGVVGLTSLGMLIFGAKGVRLSRSGLWLALGQACECIGLTLVLLMLNVGVGVIVILTARSLSGRFVSLYIVSDPSLLFLSLFQALIFQAWRAHSRHRHTLACRGGEPSHREP